jgi:hydroxymethylbilane synthase
VSTTIRLGTRGSPLALTQAGLVRDALVAAHDGVMVEILTIRTTGDRVQDRALAEIGGKALWTKELDRALLAGEIDCAVHSMKDVETVRPATIALAAMLPRADVRDRLIGADSFEVLPQGARIGTSSPRRAAQVRALRADLVPVLFRGNVDTRLAKVAAGEAEATLLAAAGLERLGRHDVGTAIPVEMMLPAPAQGAVGIEVRSDDAKMRECIRAIDDAETHACILAERALLAALVADCHSPVAALARLEGEDILLSAALYSEDGSAQVRGDARGPRDGDVSERLAADLLDRAPPAVRALFAG